MRRKCARNGYSATGVGARATRSHIISQHSVEWHFGTFGTLFSKYLLESGFRNTFENKVPGGAKVPLFCNYICITFVFTNVGTNVGTKNNLLLVFVEVDFKNTA